MKCRRGNDPSLQKRQNFVPLAVLIGQSIQPFSKPSKSTLPSPPSPHLRHARPISATLVLGHIPSQIGCWGPLPSQHRCHASKALRVAGIRRQSSKNQGGRTEERLWRGWWDTAPPEATFYSRSYPNRAHQLTPQQRASWPEILLAEPEKGRRKLCLSMWRLSSFEGSQTQAL